MNSENTNLIQLLSVLVVVSFFSNGSLRLYTLVSAFIVSRLPCVFYVTIVKQRRKADVHA